MRNLFCIGIVSLMLLPMPALATAEGVSSQALLSPQDECTASLLDKFNHSFQRLRDFLFSESSNNDYPVSIFFSKDSLENHYQQKAQSFLAGIDQLDFTEVVRGLKKDGKKIPNGETLTNFKKLRTKAQELRGLMLSIGSKRRPSDKDPEVQIFLDSLDIFDEFVSAWGKIKDVYNDMGESKKKVKGKHKKIISTAQADEIEDKAKKIVELIGKYPIQHLVDSFLVSDKEEIRQFVRDDLVQVRSYLDQELLTGWEYHQVRKSMKLMQWLIDYLQIRNPDFKLSLRKSELAPSSNASRKEVPEEIDNFRLPDFYIELKSLVGRMGDVHDDLIKRKRKDKKYNYKEDRVVEVEPAIREDIKNSHYWLALLFNVSP